MNHEEAKQVLNEVLAAFTFADTECRDDVIKVIAASVLHKKHPKLLIYGRAAGAGVGLLSAAIEALTNDDEIVIHDGGRFSVDGGRVVADDSLGEFIIITLRVHTDTNTMTRHYAFMDYVRTYHERLVEAARVYGNHIAQIF